MSQPLRGTFPKTNSRRTATNVQSIKIKTIFNLHLWREGIFATGFVNNLLVAQLPSWDLDVFVSVAIAVSGRCTVPNSSTRFSSMLDDVKSSALDYAHETGKGERGECHPTVACLCLAFERSHFGKSLDWINRFFAMLTATSLLLCCHPHHPPKLNSNQPQATYMYLSSVIMREVESEWTHSMLLPFTFLFCLMLKCFNLIYGWLELKSLDFHGGFRSGGLHNRANVDWITLVRMR